MKPLYDLDKIKFSIDEGTFLRAVDLYERGRVTKFREDSRGYSAIVLGGQPYEVFVSSRYYDKGYCACYLGQSNTICKHMIALAIQAIKRGEKLNEEDQTIIEELVFSNELGELNKEKLTEVKKSITSAMRYIKGYVGPSKHWFAYQRSLSEGCARLRKVVSELPVSKQTAQLLVDILLRLDKKLCEGCVDDSDGVVGGLIEELVVFLQEYVELDRECLQTFKKLCGVSTCFGWQEPLVRIFDEQDIDKEV
ncbi:MAG: hypothetical protein PF488_04300 [Patescibacteria group bacterium]|jgi:hypothetical protein|nr:hypothetical protein [Patescibacteria group bacterium]